MPTRLRIEYPGAIYHVLNRGNYRRAVFGTEGSKASFENTLFSACQRFGWVLHAYVLMPNHYHVALGTPEANLSIGMQWLQATFANRFNRVRNVRGHLFQGRYKSLVVDRDEYFGPLVHYIHLNPVRAQIVFLEQLEGFRWSSLWYLSRKRKRPPCLDLSRCLYYAGNLTDSPSGRSKYLSYLGWLSTSDAEQKSRCFDRMCRGWALGTQEFKKQLLKQGSVTGIEAIGSESSEARQLHWEQLLEALLNAQNKTASDVHSSRKSASWKVMIAYIMKKHTAVTNGWLSEHLHMGTIHGVSRYVSAFEKEGKHKTREYINVIAKINT